MEPAQKQCCSCYGGRYNCTKCKCAKNKEICTNCSAPLCQNRGDENQMEIIDVAKDGNCLFRCLSKCLYQTEDHHDQIRNITVNQIEKFKEFYQTQIDTGRYSNINEYINCMRKEGEWGDDVIMIAFSEAYKYNVFAKPIENMDSNWIPYVIIKKSM